MCWQSTRSKFALFEMNELFRPVFASFVEISQHFSSLFCSFWTFKNLAKFNYLTMNFNCQLRSAKLIYPDSQHHNRKAQLSSFDVCCFFLPFHFNSIPSASVSYPCASRLFKHSRDISSRRRRRSFFGCVKWNLSSLTTVRYFRGLFCQFQSGICHSLYNAQRNATLKGIST